MLARIISAAIVLLLLFGCAERHQRDLQLLMVGVLPGYGQLSGHVSGSELGVLPVVYAYNEDRSVGYTVFVVDGLYRVVNLIQGTYSITIRPAVGQLEGFREQTVSRKVASGAHVQADFALDNVGPVKNYVGGIAYPDTEIAAYEDIYPPGPGRDILERTCHGCHTIQFFPYNVSRAYSGGREPKTKDAWSFTVDRMHQGPAFGQIGNASMFDPAYLPPVDRDILVDYLAENFPSDALPRVVALESEPELNLDALRKAMFVEYVYREPTEFSAAPWPAPHQVDFDSGGNVWLAYTSCCIVSIDPRTGGQKAYKGHGGGHGIAVDQIDGSVWYSGRPDVVRHMDPRTGLVDYWNLGDQKELGSITQIFDSKGDLWLSLLGGGGLGKWDRSSDTIVWWKVPVLRSRPYGIIVDHKDKVWSADYHNGGVTRFDPETGEFVHFGLVKDDAASSIRRLGVDSKGMIWAATWGSRAFNNVKLYQLNPNTGAVIAHDVGIAYGAVYGAEADSKDNIWITPDNYISVYDQDTSQFTHYPIPVRSDTVKTTISRDDSVWFTYHNAGRYADYGGSAVVLYQDKDNIPTMAAYHSETSAGHHLSAYRGPVSTMVEGRRRIAQPEAINSEAYSVFAKSNGLLLNEDPVMRDESRRRLEGLIPD
jgi:streptogramin lyase/mono/diheme cytochrome c family protein